MTNGKGSRARPLSTSQEDFADRWAATFGGGKSGKCQQGFEETLPTRITLNEEEWDKFVELLENHTPPTPAQLRLFKDLAKAMETDISQGESSS